MGAETEILGENAPHVSSRITHNLTWDRNWAAVVADGEYSAELWCDHRADTEGGH